MVPPIRISFLGGASAIGASCALVQVADQAVLIDGGVRFRNDRPLPDLDQLNGVKLDAVLVTHAHSDHTGALPVVHEAYPGAPIYMTPPTRSLVEILQRDALHIMRQPGEREGDVPLYTERQVEGMLGQVRPVHHHAPFTLGDVRVTYLPAAHILGASMVHLETPGGNVLFTGDYSVSVQRTVGALPRPSLPVDLVVTESTYGNRAHADRKLAEERLVRTVAEVVDKGGRVLIPAFAIGRAQEVLLILREALRNGRMPRVPVFVDGMVRSVCGVYPQHESYLPPTLQRQMRTMGHPFFGSDVSAVSSPDHRKQVAAGGACVVVASSGMLSGGASAYYAGEFAGREQDAILITGYQDEESPGRALLKLAQQQGSGPRTMRLGGREVEVRCRFESYSLSAHADRMQMVGLMEALNPLCVALVHGDAEAKESLAQSLGERDVALCEDGVQLERVFPRRRTSAGSTPRLDRARAEALVGPDQGAPIDQKAVVVAWFGHEVPQAEQTRFFEALRELGVVRRDEADPGQLRSCVEVSPEVQALELEQKMRLENPKGKLLEWCMRRRAQSPELHEKYENEEFFAELVLTVDGAELRSGWHSAGSKKAAEQLAAQALLAQLDQSSASEAPHREVREPELSQRKSRNPKGKLLELCAKYHMPLATFEAKVAPGGHLRRGLLRMHGGHRHQSAWYLAPTARDAEQAASDELLDVLWAWKNNKLPAPSAAPDSPDAPAQPPPPPSLTGGHHPKSKLNMLQQKKEIDAFGFDTLAQRGSAHAPLFEVRGWFERDGERTQGPAQQGPSKKDAETLAATALLALLDAESP